MKVLLATDCFPPTVGGVQTVVRELAGGLSAAGHDVEVVTVAVPGLPHEETFDGVRVTRIRLGRPAVRPRAVLGFLRRVGAARREFESVVDRLQPDVAHLHFLQSPLAYLVPSIVHRRGVPLVATAHGRDVGVMVRDDVLGRWAVRRVLRSAVVVTAPSGATLLRARSLAGEVPARFDVVPNSLPRDCQHLLDEDLSEGQGSVFAVGALIWIKGLDVLIEALSRLPGVVLRLAGTGPVEADLRRLAAERGVDDRVEFLGRVARARFPDELRRASVVVVPSRSEAFGIVVLEGFAAGRPVIASDVGGLPEVAGEAALLVPPDDAAALAGALREVLADAELSDRLSRAGRERVRAFTPDATRAAYVAVYERALAAT